MSREAIKDPYGRVTGHVETDSAGRQKALNPYYRLLGIYDPRQNETRDANGRLIARGNVLAALIVEAD
ncbi:hypothetical protein [Methylobacterium oxalidis]|uniref:hypothetical protein n=1 Tax=Methylobacterium oxalidis TaxID=944322 RepID=UPI0033149607